MNREQLLWRSCRRGWAGAAQILVEQGAYIHANSEWALRLAAWNGHLEIVKWLVAQGANIHAWEERALRSAAECGHLEVVKFLVSQGANVRTALNRMKKRGSSQESILLLEGFL